MSELQQQFISALREAIAEAGSQVELAKKIGMQQGRISDYLKGRYEFENMTVGTLLKLFPDLDIIRRKHRKTI